MKKNYLNNNFLLTDVSFDLVRLFSAVLLLVIPIAMVNAQCSGTVYDSGGSGGNYGNNENTITVLDAGAGNIMQISFNEFNLENNYDFVRVYDGQSISDPLINSFTGTTIPSDIVASGQYLTIRLESDGSVVAPGYSITLSCIVIPPVPECIAIAQWDNGNLFSWTTSPNNNSFLGTLNATEIETVAMSYDGQTIYAANAGVFGSVNHYTGLFTPIGTIGDAEGPLGTMIMDDVDGMAINPTNGYIMAVHRRNSDNDLFFVINPTTGAVERNYFGPGVDYREIVGALQDMDDIAFHPMTYELYGISTISGSTTFDQLVLIDQYLGTVSPVTNLPTCDIEGLSFNGTGVLYGSSGYEECAPYASNTIYEIDYSSMAGTVTPITTLSIEDVEGIACYVAAVEPCNDVVSGGEVGSYQTICRGDDVAAFTNIEGATLSGGTNLEYQWYYSTTQCIPPLNNDPEWIPIPGATGITYDHGPLFESTCFVRGAKTTRCSLYIKYSNVIPVDVNLCACPSPTIATFTITDGSDDVEERQNGEMYVNSTDLELTRDNDPQTVGMRFNNINIPSYALINSARLVFDADESHSDPTNLIIQAELIGNSPPFDTTDFNLTQRNLTNNIAVWGDLESWTTDNVYTSVYFNDVIDEVIKQPTWSPGNSLSIVITGAGKRVADSYEEVGGTPAQLVIEYCDAEICGNGLDDDGDGYVDSFDPDCPSYAPFNCDQSFYQSKSSSGSTYVLDEIITDPLSLNQVYDLTSNGMTALGFNALAFNPVDRFMYGINPLTSGNYEFYRINNIGAIQYIGNITGLSGVNDAGCMGSDGRYFVAGANGILSQINTSTLVSTQIANIGFTIGDMAINPDDNLIYAWNSDANQLYTINPITGASSAIGSADTQYTEFGSFFFDEQGSIIAYGNDDNVSATGQETLVRIDPATGIVSPIGTTTEVSGNDGCSCAFGVGFSKQASSSTAIPGDNLSYTFTIYNRTGAALQNITFSDVLPTGFTFSSNPYNLTGLTLGAASINGTSSANFVITNVPVGSANTFTIDITIPIDYCGEFENQARLLNLDSEFGSIVISDDPSSPDINDPTTTTVDNCEEYWLEAECENVGANWNIISDGSASRNSYATINAGFNSLGSAPTGVDDRIRFNVTVGSAGNYNVFGRVNAPTSNDDSFWVRANGGTWYRWNSLSSFASAGWEWVQVYNSDAGGAIVTFPLVAGANTIDFAYREDGTRLDKIKVSLGDELPTGEGGISLNCPEICDNGLDDDGDGLTDCEDDDCSSETFCQGPCIPEKLFVERWYAVSGTLVSDLTSDVDYPNNPSEIDYITSFQGPSNIADNYGTRVRGFIIPSESGTYTFNVTGDDNTILYLSTDVDEANMTEIASVPGWSGISNHNTFPEQTSIEIELQAGVWYYVELLNKEGSGGDHFQVYWRTPSVPATWNIIPGGNLAPYVCPEICDNGEDDDNDGFEDCLDPDCESGVNVSVTSADNSICVGETATLDAESSGSPGTLTYSWSGGAGSSKIVSVSPSSTTTYTVTVTNTNGCQATDQIQVTVNNPPSASATNDGDITCSNPTVTLTATPAGMTYAWSGGGTGQTKDVTSAGTYTVTVTNANGCTDIASTTVVEDTNTPTANAGSDQVICIGESASLVASGGGSYIWDNGTSGNSLTVSPIVTTNYSVTVTAANGCTDTDAVQIMVNQLPNPSINKDGDIQCDNSSVQLTAEPSGMTYAWSGGGTGQTKDVTSGGTYTVTVTDANSCSNTAQITVDEFLTPTSIVCERYRLREFGTWGTWTSFSGTCELDFCVENGGTDIQIDGGPNLNTGWVWTDEDGNIDGEIDEIVYFADLAVSDSGVYTGQYTNQYGCVSTINIDITVHPNPSASIANDGPITCSLPNVTLTASPAGMIYDWDGVGTNQTYSVSNANTYNLTITDTNGCTDVASSIVTVDTIPPVADAGEAQAICLGESASLTASGGVSYDWSNSAGNTAAINVSPSVTTTYTVTVTAANGCTDVDNVTVTVNPLPVISASNNGPITCNLPNVTLTAMPAGMKYQWQGGGTDQTNLVSATGNYSVTISDANGCTSVTSTTVTDDITPPVANAGGDVTICDGESTDLTATGVGSYAWSNSAGNTSVVSVSPSSTTTYTVTVTAANGCTNTDQVVVTVTPLPVANISSPTWICEGTAASISAANAGVGASYTWNFGANALPQTATGIGPHNVIYDNTNATGNDLNNSIELEVILNGCTNQDNNNIRIEAIPAVTVSSTPPSCGIDDGTITFSFGDNTSRTNIQFSLNGGVSYPYDYSDNIGSATLSNLASGSYDLYVRWGNGECPMDLSDIVFPDNTVPDADAGEDQAICLGETTDLTATGVGTYSWSNGGGSNSVISVTPNTTTTYTVTVTGSNGCTDVDNVVVTVNPLPVVSASNNGPITCSLPDVTLTALPAGMTYQWQGGGADQTKIVSTTGTYSVTVTDANGCTGVTSTTVTDDLTPPVAEAGDDELICEGVSIDLTATGGVFYEWSNGAGNTAVVSVSPTTTTTYTVTVTAANGCQDTDDVTITVDPKPIVNVTGSDTICVQTTTTLSPSTGGTWQSSDNSIAIVSNSGIVFGLNPGTVSFTFTSAATGCPSDATADVTITPDLTLAIDYIGGVCLQDGSQLSAIVTGGTMDFAYSWTGPNGFTATTQTIDIPESGNYYITVTDVAGCSDATSGYMYSEYNPFIFTLNTEVCEDEEITLSVNSSTATAYQWSANAGNATSQSVTVTPGLPSEDYFVTVTNDIGCTTEATVHIDVKAKAAVAVSGPSEICIGESTNLTPTTGGIWTSSNNSIAGVTNDGTVVGLSAGTVTFTFLDSSTDCESDPTTPVTIYGKPTVSVSGPDVLCEGETTNLTPNTGGTWASNNPSLATVTNDGTVTALSAGTVSFVFTDGTTGCPSDATTDITINQTYTTTFTGPSTVCLGDNTYLSPTTGGSWSSSDEAIAIVSNIGVITTLSAGSATFTFTSDYSCVSNATSELTVVPNDVITISGDSELCEDDVITLMASYPGGTWSSSNNTIATIDNSGQVTGISYGNAVITYTHDPNQCANNPTFNITIKEKPTVSLNGPAEICAGEVSSVTTSGTGGIWLSSDESVAIVSNDGTIVGLSAGLATFSYVSSNNCESDATIPITVNPAVEVEIDFVGSVCLEDDTKLTAAITGGTPIYTYSWSGPGGFVSDQDTIDVVLSGLYNVLVTDGAGCSSNTTAYVYESYDPFLFALDTEICEGEDVTLSVNGSSGGTYQWSANAGSSTSQSVTVTPSVPGDTYYVTITSTQGCTTVANAEITVDALPNVTLTGADSICVGTTTTLSPTTGGLWSSSNYSVASISNSGVVSGLAPGGVTFTYRDISTGCYSAPTTSIAVEANENVLIDGNNDLCMGIPQQLVASVVGGEWSSVNPSIATISPTGTVTPVAPGTTSILYTTPANTCFNLGSRSISVNNIPTVNVNGPTTICEGEITYLVPSNGGTWVSDDPSVATVSNIGIVTGVSGGTASFTFTSAVGCVQTLSSAITIIPKPVVSLTGPSNICVDGTTTLSPTTGGIWISSNNIVATVSSSGLVIANNPGVVEFTFVEFTNGCISSDIIEVTVNSAPTITALADDELCIGEITYIGPNTGGTWASSNPLVASISSTGAITAVSAGAATFRYTDSTTGCVSEESAAVIVNDHPTINITGSTDLCIGESSSILPNSGGTWSTSDISIATITNEGIISAVTAGDVTFTFTSNTTGCGSIPSDVFTVSNPSNANITGPTSMCIGTTETLLGSENGTWESSDDAIASVSNTGIITANAPGIVTITLNTTATCITNPTIDVLVDPEPNPVFTGPTSICLGTTTTLSPTTGGVWTSSDESIATIDNLGNVTSVASGVVDFIFTDDLSGCTSETSTSLSIFSKPTINIDGQSSICIGEITNMSPSSGGIWTSSDPSIATIEPNGSVTGISAGAVTFTFTESGTTCVSDASSPVTILPKPNVSIVGPSSFCIGSSTTLSPNTGGSWISADESIATVTDEGVVTGVGAGVVKFTFISNAGCSSNQTSPIIIFGLPTISIDGPSDICVGDNVQMLPSAGGTWVSSDPLVATISNAGVVTAVSPGSTSFVFTDSGTGCISASSDLLTVNPITLTGLNGPDDICIGATTNFTPTVGGIWSSVNPSIATISNNGEVTGIAAGSARFLFTQLSTGCISDTTEAIVVSSESTPVFTGPEEICIGGTTSILPNTGGTWESTNTDVATITDTGIITGVGQGTAKFSFTNQATGCISSQSSSVTVNGLGTVFVDGEDEICIGSFTTLSPNSGGTWVSLNTDIASVTPAGVVTGIAEGTASFVFTDAVTGCSSNGDLEVVVQALTPIDLNGIDEVCIGYTIQLSPTTGGLWSSNNEAIATITNSGVVKGRAPGKVTFTFNAISNGCVNQSISDSITVISCKNHDFNVAVVDQEIFGNISTNDNFPVAATYSNTPSLISKPDASIANFIINSDGSYSFEGSKPGNYRYNVPVCLAPFFNGCPTTMIEFTLVENQYSTGNPVTNMDIATVFGVESINRSRASGGKVGINTNQNDVCIYTLGCEMDWSSAWIDADASNGLAEVKPNGIIDYTPDAGFIGFDTIYYGMCADGYSSCNTSMQILTVNHATAINSVVASDDFIFTLRGSSVSGNVLANDSDAEGDNISVNSQGTLLTPIVTSAGEYYIDALGNFDFTPNDMFSGHTEIIYEICDDNTDQACMQATLHLLVFDDISVKMRVYLQGALMQNGGATSITTGLPLMRDDLRVSPYTGENYIPLFDPYSITADPFVATNNMFNKIGPGLLDDNIEIKDSLGVFGVSGDNAIVDWVHVELRSKANMAQPIATRSGLVQRDGDIVDLDGVSDLRFNSVNVDSFYVVVKHRSHLGVMSQKVSHTDQVDFTDPNYPVFNFGTKNLNDYSGLSQNNNVVSGYSALWAGDFDSNGKVKFTNPGDDQNVLFIDVLFSSPDFLINYDQAYGYMTGDFNMNSKTKYTNPSDDINYLFSQILLYPLNSSFLSNFNSLIEQIEAQE